MVIFDPNTIIDRATYEQPTLPPNGIDCVLVSGQVAVRGQQMVNGTLGRFIPKQD